MKTLFCFLFLSINTAIFAVDTTGTNHWNKAGLTIPLPKKFLAGKQTEITVMVTDEWGTEWTGYVSLELNDEQSKQNVDGLFANVFPSQYFTVSAGDSSLLFFPVNIPHLFGPIPCWFLPNFSMGKHAATA